MQLVLPHVLIEGDGANKGMELSRITRGLKFEDGVHFFGRWFESVRR